MYGEHDLRRGRKTKKQRQSKKMIMSMLSAQGQFGDQYTSRKKKKKRSKKDQKHAVRRGQFGDQYFTRHQIYFTSMGGAAADMWTCDNAIMLSYTLCGLCIVSEDSVTYSCDG